MGLLNSPVLGSPLYGHAWSFWVCIWIAAAVSALLGVVIGAPTLRVRGDYLAIITLGFGEIIPVAIRNLGDITIDIGGWRPIVRLNLTGRRERRQSRSAVPTCPASRSRPTRCRGTS